MRRFLLVLLIAPTLALADRPARPGNHTATLAAPLPSIHALEREAHRGEAPAARVLALPPTPHPHPGLSRVVYGYYPYWVGHLDSIRWQALTHLAWFCVELTASGGISARHGWPDATTVDAAHAAGVRVDLAFTLFNDSGHDYVGELCADPDRRAAAINNMIDEMEDGGADGINVDFEGLKSGTRDHFTTFVTELRAAMTARGHADAELSIAGPSDWLSQFDLPALLEQIDYYFIMAYGYFWSGSSYAGPPGLVRVSSDWRPAASISAVRSIAQISAMITPVQRQQIVYGVPFYGREWSTANDNVPSHKVESLGPVTFAEARAALAGGKTRRWHEGIRNPWYMWQAGTVWHQVWYEDEESLAVKYQLAIDENLGGIGIWALNYDVGYPELWDGLQAKFVAEPPPPAGHRLNPLPVAAFPFHDARSTADGPSQYFNFYSSPDDTCGSDIPEYGREWVYSLDLCQPGTLAVHVPAYPDRDPDVHLLAALEQDACLARAHTDFSLAVTPARYYLTVDTFVDDSVEQEGPYELDVDFVADPASSPCAAYLICRAGACVCPSAGTVDCGAACVDTASDAAHCGACDNSCASDETCREGVCHQEVEPQPVDAGALQGDGGLVDGEEGCGCRLAAGEVGAAPPFVVVALVLVALALARPRRRRS